MSKKLITCAAVVSGMFFLAPAMAVDLVGVHDLAAKNDPRLAAASLRRDAVAEYERQAWSNLLPTLSGGAGVTRGDTSSDIRATSSTPNVYRESDIDTESWRLDFSQSLYDQANYEQLDIGRAQLSQGDAIYQLAYQDFLVRVAAAYFNVLTAQDRVITAEAEERALQRQFEQAEQRFEVGLTAVTDVHEARATYDNARARAIVERNVLADTREALRELTGQYFEDIDPLQEKLPLVSPEPNSVDEWVDIAMSSNPAVISAQYAVDIADANARLQRTGHFPSLGLVASYSDFTNNALELTGDAGNRLATTELQSDELSYGLRLNVPIYQGGVVSSRTRQARYELGAVQQDLDAQQRATMRATRDAFRAVIAGIEQVQAFEQARISAESALQATQAGFEVGTRTIVDVLIAEQRFYQAERDNSTARHAYIVDHLRLKAAAGVLATEDLQAVNSILD
jgi:outer membrane protein